MTELLKTDDSATIKRQGPHLGPLAFVSDPAEGVEPAGRGAPQDMSPCLRTGECRRRAPGMQARRREIPAGSTIHPKSRPFSGRDFF